MRSDFRRAACLVDAAREPDRRRSRAPGHTRGSFSGCRGPWRQGARRLTSCCRARCAWERRQRTATRRPTPRRARRSFAPGAARRTCTGSPSGSRPEPRACDACLRHRRGSRRVRSRSAPPLPSADRRRAPSACAHANPARDEQTAATSCTRSRCRRGRVARARERAARAAPRGATPQCVTGVSPAACRARTLAPRAALERDWPPPPRAHRRGPSRSRRRTRGPLRSTDPPSCDPRLRRAPVAGRSAPPACGGELLVRRSWSTPESSSVPPGGVPRRRRLAPCLDSRLSCSDPSSALRGVAP